MWLYTSCPAEDSSLALPRTGWRKTSEISMTTVFCQAQLLYLWTHTVFFRVSLKSATTNIKRGRSQWPSGLRLDLWTIACWDCRFESHWGHGCFSVVWCCLCDGPIPFAEQSYQLWCVSLCDLETTRMRRRWAALGYCARRKFKTFIILAFNTVRWKWLPKF